MVVTSNSNSNAIGGAKAGSSGARTAARRSPGCPATPGSASAPRRSASTTSSATGRTTPACMPAGQQGIFRSDDTGATWTNVTNGAALQATIQAANTNNLELAVHNSGGTNVVYAGVINNGQLGGLFRSTDQGANWTQLDTPATHEGATTVGINPRPKPGGQGGVHFSILADADEPEPRVCRWRPAAQQQRVPERGRRERLQRTPVPLRRQPCRERPVHVAHPQRHAEQQRAPRRLARDGLRHQRRHRRDRRRWRVSPDEPVDDERRLAVDQRQPADQRAPVVRLRQRREHHPVWRPGHWRARAVGGRQPELADAERRGRRLRRGQRQRRRLGPVQQLQQPRGRRLPASDVHRCERLRELGARIPGRRSGPDDPAVRAGRRAVDAAAVHAVVHQRDRSDALHRHLEPDLRIHRLARQPDDHPQRPRRWRLQPRDRLRRPLGWCGQ